MKLIDALNRVRSLNTKTRIRRKGGDWFNPLMVTCTWSHADLMGDGWEIEPESEYTWEGRLGGRYNPMLNDHYTEFDVNSGTQIYLIISNTYGLSAGNKVRITIQKLQD